MEEGGETQLAEAGPWEGPLRWCHTLTPIRFLAATTTTTATTVTTAVKKTAAIRFLLLAATAAQHAACLRRRQRRGAGLTLSTSLLLVERDRLNSCSLLRRELGQ